MLKRIASDGHRASQVIGSVRGMFQKEGRPREHLAVNDIIGEILVLVQGEVRRHRVTVRSDFGFGLPTIDGDRVQLQQVFLNLVLNAIESMTGVAPRERVLTVGSRVGESETVEITIEDSGVGVAPTDAERIFDAFYTTKSEGIGMGLFICRSIIESHGGRLWVSPRAPHGSIFHVTLPSADR